MSIIVISLNNTNQPSFKSNEAGDVVLTPVPIMPYINEVSDIDRIHDVFITPLIKTMTKLDRSCNKGCKSNPIENNKVKPALSIITCRPSLQ